MLPQDQIILIGFNFSLRWVLIFHAKRRSAEMEEAENIPFFRAISVGRDKLTYDSSCGIAVSLRLESGKSQSISPSRLTGNNNNNNE